MLPTKINAGAVTVKKDSALDRAKERFEAVCRRRYPTRIGFIVDATGSRTDTWEQAQTMQGRMFRAAADVRSLALRLVHYGGTHLVDHGWGTQAVDTAMKMAQVRCERGMTQIVPALKLFIQLSYPPKDDGANAVIVIGDAFEESIDDLENVAAVLALFGIKVFSFLEGEDMAADRAFRRLAEITGGKFAKLGATLPLADLCEGVVLLTTGGEKAVRRLPNKQAQQLLLTGPTKK